MSGTQTRAYKEELSTYLQQTAQAQGFLPEVVMTQYAGQATELAAAAVSQGIRRVIAIGGDGTINEVARALRHSSTSLGIVPLGSGNGLARHLGLPLRAKPAIQRALMGKPVLIDSAEINNIPFFCTAGMGFEAHVAHEFARQKTRGLLTYVQTAWRAYQQYQPATYQLFGQTRRLFTLTFANAAQFGNNAWIAPVANIADGQLDVCQLLPFPGQAGLTLSYQLFTRTIQQSRYWQSQAVRSVVVQAPQPLEIHADGEPIILDSGEVRVRVLPGSLLVIL